MAGVSAVLFAKDHTVVARFYREALGLVCTASGDDHVVLNCHGFDLVIHQIPGQYLHNNSNADQAVKRGNGPLRLDFPVDSIETTRSIAATLGGKVDDTPPPWAGPDANIYLGHDPEGNVFKLSECAP